MLLLLIGGACFLGALRVTRRGRVDASLADGAWGVAIAALAIVQLVVARHDLARYQITLLGLRYAIRNPTTSAASAPIAIGGDYATTDFNVRGTGPRPVAHLRPVRDSAVLVTVPDQPAAVTLLQRGRGDWRVVGARAFGAADTLAVQLADTVVRIALAETREVRLWGLAGRGADAFGRVADSSGNGHRVRLAPITRSWRDRLRGGRIAGVYERAYPMADIIAGLVDTTAVTIPPLSSFFFYQDGRLQLADLDDAVDFLRAPIADTVWTPALDGSIRIAGLPHRDFTTIEDEPPARGGIRTLYTGAVTLHGPWLDITSATPEILSFDTEALRQVALDGMVTGEVAGGDRYRHLRFTGVRTSSQRRAIAFDAPPKRFEASAQAVLRLPRDPIQRRIVVLTPTGRSEIESGRPFGLGDDERQELLRIDGKGTSPAFWLLLLVTVGVPAALLFLRPLGAVAFAIALAAFSLAILRLLLGLSAAIDFPFVLKGLETGWWLVPALPWMVIALGSAREVSRSRVHLAIHTSCALLLSGFAAALFRESTVIWIVLASMCAVALAFVWLGRSPWAWLRDGWQHRRDARAAKRRNAPDDARAIRSHTPTVERAGFRLHVQLAAGGAILLVGRVVAFAFGFHEAIAVGGTRLALSTVYTPAALGLLAWLVARLAREARAGRIGVVGIVGQLWGYLFVAYAVVAGVVSDAGIVLVTAVGSFVFLCVLAAHWMEHRTEIMRLSWRAALALPLVMFVVAQLRADIMLEPRDPERPLYTAAQWDANKLRILGQSDPEALALIGQRQSEALRVMVETMRRYTRGPGLGFLHGDVSPDLRATATREHVVSALLAAQWGPSGPMALVLMLLALLLAASRVELTRGDARSGTAPHDVDAGRFPTWEIVALIVVLWLLWLPLAMLPRPWSLIGCALLPPAAVSAWLRGLETHGRERLDARVISGAGAAASLFLLTVAVSGFYMVLANYDWVAFTGKNVYVLGLDSIGDVLESAILLAGAAWLASVASRRQPPIAEAE